MTGACLPILCLRATCDSSPYIIMDSCPFRNQRNALSYFYQQPRPDKRMCVRCVYLGSSNGTLSRRICLTELVAFFSAELSLQTRPSKPPKNHRGEFKRDDRRAACRPEEQRKLFPIRTLHLLQTGYSSCLGAAKGHSTMVVDS